MQHIAPSTLTSLTPRLNYTTAFLHFIADDGAAIQTSGPLIAPLIQVVLDAIYSNLLSFDITAKAFMPKTQADHASTKAPSTPQELNLQHAHIKRQMNFLQGYLLKIVHNKDWTSSSDLWTYMDKVAIAHTGLPGFQHRAKRPELRVEYMHLGLLLGYVEDIILGAVIGMDVIDIEKKGSVIRAWSKLLWLQNDLFARRYVVDKDTGEKPTGLDREAGSGDLRLWGMGLLGLFSAVLSVFLYGRCG